MKCFCLTLERTPQRTETIRQHFDEIGLTNVDFFYGLDGDQRWRTTTRHTYEVDNPGSNYHIGPITIALALSHYALWNHVLHIEGEDTFMIMENDCRFLNNWRSRLDSAVAHLPSGWGMLYPGSCCLKLGKQVHEHLWEAAYAVCLHCYVINKWSAERLIDVNQRLWGPIDIAIQLESGLPRYAIHPRICDQGSTVIPV